MIRKYLISRRRFMKYSWLGLAGLAGVGSWVAVNKQNSNQVNPTQTSQLSSSPVKPTVVSNHEGKAPIDRLNVNQLTPSAVSPQPGLPPLKAGNSIAAENNQPGTTDWLITKSGDDTLLQIKGYASATSINRGGTINFHVSVNPVQDYTLEIYRIGWYKGLGGRLMKSVGPLPGKTFPVPEPDAFGTVACNWPVAHTLDVPADWTSGVYLVKLTNAAGWQNYIHFVVRDDLGTHDLMFQSSVTTYHAYNNFGGKSLYDTNSDGAVPAVKVSLDRPYSETGMGQFFFYEMPLLRFIESQGFDVSYCTNIDMHANPALAKNIYKGFISSGHDEYWSQQMYDNILSFRQKGINLAFFGANAIYWQIRLESSAQGVPNRVIVGYKNRFKEDPAYPGPNTTYLWREMPVDDTQTNNSRPENGLIGVMFDSWSNSNPGQNFVVDNSTHWVYAGTGFTDGTVIKGIVGYEWDKRYDNGFEPAGLQQLSNSRVLDEDGTTSVSHATIYQAASGSWIFSTGSIYWSFGLDFCGFQINDLRNKGIQQATRNVLDRFVGNATAS